MKWIVALVVGLALGTGVAATSAGGWSGSY